MSDFECPYCGEGNENNSLSDYFDGQDEIEIDCKSCKRTLSLYREFDPVYYPSSIENQIKGEAEVFKQMVDAYKTDGPMPDWAQRLLSNKKEVIKQLGELIKKNRQVGDHA